MIGIFIEKMIIFMNRRPGNLEMPWMMSPWKSITAKKIAIVGYNGAGKTTLTKLLMRLYDPDEGEILYNGKNIRKYTVSSLKEHIAAVFQDYRIFACTIAKNVVGGKYAATDASKVKTSLEKSTFSDKLQSLTAGLNTQLAREFDNNRTQ